jgi:HNH endonuclease
MPRSLSSTSSDGTPFLEKYGFGRSTRFVVRVNGRDYDSKALLGAAHGKQFPELGPLPHNNFSGGQPTIRRLEQLGFTLVNLDGDELPERGPNLPAPRVIATVERLQRDSAVSRRVKALHDQLCQICGQELRIPGALYSEGAHIRPLGRPHDGSDVLANILCLCPNDHVRFDTGAIHIRDDFTIVDSTTAGHSLRTVPAHHIDVAAIRYHRHNIAVPPWVSVDQRR